ncbi:hypothetical protein [Actinomadura sp. 21ATH]|uniref:GAP1-N2 domain-containing protein n=1 Tax=Actinomadura sp. 21ATH TaxID=1735444 RepID=UPI0035BFC563
MAWQLHYTSARRGPTGRAGFQFVAETPGLPEGARAGVTPYLSYRPPPDAPLSPDDGELGRFPVALLYDRVAERPLLLRCRYLGQDYSGRYGNFFAHAVVAEEEELEGLRPAELWHSPLWSDGPARVGELPVLDDLAPGDGSDPESLAHWLHAQDGAFTLLGRLMDAVAGVLAKGHGRVVLVAGDVEPIARWIAVVSYSLPVAAAARMSFVTYSADPDAAAQRLVGTTPDVWAAAQRLAGHAFHLPGGRGPGDGEASRFARTVAACWRDFDFAGLDALGELAPPGAAAPPEALDEAAALLALCRGDRTVTPREEEAVTRLLARRGGAMPDWVWRDLAQSAPAMGVDLALAVHRHAREAGAAGSGPAIEAALAAAPDLAEVARIAAAADGPDGVVGGGVEVAVREAAARCVRGGDADVARALGGVPAGVRGALLDGCLAGLAGAEGEVRRAVLTPEACDLLYEDVDRLRGVPEIAGAVLVPVLVSVGRRRSERRLTVTGELLHLGTLGALGAAGADRALARVWVTAPTAAQCLALLDLHAGAFAEHPALAALPSRAFARLAAEGDRALMAPDALRLAARVREALPDGGDAAVIQAYAEAVTAERPERAAKALAATAASAGLADDLLAAAAGRLAERPPRFRAALLAALDGAPRSRLGALWAAALPGRARSGRAPLRGEEIARRNELMEVVLRLRRGGAAEPALETWARSAAGRRLSARQLDAHFSRAPELRAALRELVAEARGD